MPITFGVPPTGAQDAIDKGLALCPKAEGLDKTRKDQLRGPIATYCLPADAVLAGGELDRAELTGWRYLIDEAGTSTRAAELTVASDGSARLYSVVGGPAVPGTARALALAQKMPEAGENTYEARLLSVPGLPGQALWLHCVVKPEQDRFFLLPPIFGRLEEGKPYSSSELLPTVRELVAKRIAAQPKPAPPGGTP